MGSDDRQGALMGDQGEGAPEAGDPPNDSGVNENSASGAPIVALKRDTSKTREPSREALEAYGGPPPQTLKDVAKLLDLRPHQLTYALFSARDNQRYATFEIPKRTGGMRRIDSPIGVIRTGQKRLAPILAKLHRPHPASQGFLPERSILTNAEAHAGQRLVLNVDLADFFPSINFGRVRGLFRAPPFHMGDAAATVCAQLCTFRNGLPQGAPTSPVLSNYIATGLDRRLHRLARENRCRYTRYADDITFSTGAPALPVSLCAPLGEGMNAPVEVGPALAAQISAAGFAVNPKKVRLQRRSVRQSVTGVTVNEKPNVDRLRVRRIRAMVHAWRKFGLEAAAAEHLRKKVGRQNVGRNDRARVFRNALYGELAFLKMLRGEDDPLYRKFCAQLLALDGAPPKTLRRMLFGADDYQVFISHATEDKEAIARPIFEACEKLGVKAFIDQEHINWGESFTAKIQTALAAAPVVLAVVTDASVTKDWPLAELNTALALEVEGEKTVAAVVVGRPDLSKLPLLRQKNYMVWKSDPEAVATRLKEIVEGGGAAGSPNAPAAKTGGAARKRTIWDRLRGRK